MFLLLASGWITAPLRSADANQTNTGRITFVGKNAIATANGVFHRWKIVERQLDLAALGTGFIVIEIDVASLDTDNKRRDDHLRTVDFFEVERWPKARVRVHNASRRIELFC